MALIQGQKNQSKVNSAIEYRNPFFFFSFFFGFFHEIQPHKATRFFQLANNPPNIINLVFYWILSQELLLGKSPMEMKWVLHVRNRTRCEEPLLVTGGRLAQRSFSSSSITWFMALFSHVSTDTPICFSRSRRASAFSLIIWGNKHGQVKNSFKITFRSLPPFKRVISQSANYGNYANRWLRKLLPAETSPVLHFLACGKAVWAKRRGMVS